MDLKRLSCTFYVADQLEIEDLQALARRGIRSVINNRPDGEAEGQVPGKDLEAAALQAGLNYRHVPVVSKNVSEAEEAAFRKSLQGLPEPICGFCRTGTRAAICWALSQHNQQTTHAIVEAVVGAGFAGEDLEQQLGMKTQRLCGEINHASK